VSTSENKMGPQQRISADRGTPAAFDKTGCDTRAIADWLIAGARSASNMQCTIAELCERLLACGIPLWRFGLFVLTLDPLVQGVRFLWTPDAAVDVSPGSFEAFLSDDFRGSPVRHVIDTGVALRRKLRDKECPIDFTMLRELREQGASDYLVVPLFFINDTVHGAAFATQQPEGFTDAQIAALEAVVAPLARIAENRTLQRTAGTLLDTYVGNHAGSRILAGQIRRGDTTALNAAIWLSDMRGFTRRADHMPPQMLIDLLNRYFDCQVPAILRHGGEVLKFMGDGLLAIFAIDPNVNNTREICEAALAAACEARAAITTSFSAEARDPTQELRFGLALHVGEVLYGNIGSGNRLDFTCIGRAVNLAARIEKLTGEMKRTMLASEEFARHVPSKLVPVAEFLPRGFGTTRTVFGLEDETAGSSTSDRSRATGV
jgi:adenylate cyclase